MQLFEGLIGQIIEYGDGDVPERAKILGARINTNTPEYAVFRVKYASGKIGEIPLATGLAGFVIKEAQTPPLCTEESSPRNPHMGDGRR